jgi:DNA-binding XRE family transcriptional regulator
MEHENHIGERIGVKDADRALATEPAGSLAPLGAMRVLATVTIEGGDGGGGAAASLHDSDAEPASEPTPAAAHVAPVAALKGPVADPEEDEPKAKKAGGRGPHKNNVRKLRIERMMSKAELARRANLSVLTIDRVEKGFGCRMDSKRKILEALGLSLADRVRVFGEEE